MKTPVRFQSRLLLRRSYKPARGSRIALGVRFRDEAPFAVKIADAKKSAPPADDSTFAYSI